MDRRTNSTRVFVAIQEQNDEHPRREEGSSYRQPTDRPNANGNDVKAAEHVQGRNIKEGGGFRQNKPILDGGKAEKSFLLFALHLHMYVNMKHEGFIIGRATGDFVTECCRILERFRQAYTI